MSSEPARAWRLVFEGGDPATMVTVSISRGAKLAAVDEVVAEFKRRVRAAMEAGGCRSFVVGVHVEGSACDHEVG